MKQTSKIFRILNTPFYLLKRQKQLKGMSLLDLYWVLRKNEGGTTQFLGKRIAYFYKDDFINNIQELFYDEPYRFQTDRPNPRILDCGAYIGLSVIYFKQLFPTARITAFEADPHVFETLEKNISVHHYEGVELVNRAIWHEEAELEFHSDQTMCGSLMGGTQANMHKVKVKTTRLKPYLQEKIDFLKIDIEGAEYQVIKDIEPDLHNVERMFIEYHSIAGEDQKLDEMLSILHRAGFRYYIQEANPYSRWPFLDVKREGFDLQLNLFLFR